MERRDLLKFIAGGTAGAVVAGLGINSAALQGAEKCQSCTGEKKMKKFTNADFYKDGKFQTDVALKAYFDMFERFHYSLTDVLRGNKEFWAVDFGLGDFENVGMGGIFWWNSKEFRYFAHEIYLLPGQMIPEHFHLAAEDLPAKHETWHVRNGSIFNFGIGGEKTPETLKMLPKSQLDAGAITCFKWKKMVVGDMDSLTGLGDPHFMMGGPEGAIVSEYGSYHSMKGLNFTNKKAAL
ncbi:MAG: hypothetical protein Q4G69_12620 [Planctomycetia bacterium]|nr:hypothetical protein [Planctomycetia bacterium]